MAGWRSLVYLIALIRQRSLVQIQPPQPITRHKPSSPVWIMVGAINVLKRGYRLLACGELVQSGCSVGIPGIHAREDVKNCCKQPVMVGKTPFH